MTVTVPGTVSRDDIVGISSNDKIGSSLCLSFDNDKVFISSNSYNNNTGLVRIYESTGTYNFNWNLLATLNGNSNDDFGLSIDATWDGDILCVGAPGNNKIYIYEDTSGSKNWSSYVSNSISGNSNSEFGFSVSINKDTGNNIAVGAPGENTVNVIQKVGGTWSSSWSNTWTTSLFRNYIYENSGATGTQTLLYIDETSTGGSPRYGHSVSISGYGNYLAVGAPGVNIAGTVGLDVSNVYYTNGTQPSSFIRSGVSQTHTRPFETAALGHVVCYKTSNVLSDWRTHSTVSQYGPVIRGDTADDTDTMPKTYEPTHSWGFPACGKRVQMSIDGSKVMAGSPHYAKAGKHAFSSGKIEGWEYNQYDDTWVIGKAPLVGGGERRLGLEFVLDYAGTRAVSCTRKNNGGNGEVLVIDFNGTGWYEVAESIPFNSFTGPSGIHTSNGELIAVADPQDSSNKGKIRFYDFPLTQIIEGNTLASGYIAADSLRIGSNDNAVNDNVPKRISFGGTYQDNEYHMTEIENRSFFYDELNSDVDLQGNSELVFMKKSTGDMCDMIRMKANEFRIDNYLIGDGDYDHTPRLTMDNVGNFKLNAEMTFNSERGQADIKALLDIEGDCFTRRRLNAGLSTGNDTLGTNKYPFNILYDTRTSLVKNNNNATGLVSNVNVWNRGVGGQSTRWNTNGPISGTINYHATEGAISLNTTSSYSENTGQAGTISATTRKDNGSVRDPGGFKISFWIKLQNTHSTYSTKTLVGVGTLATSGVTGCRVQITNDRIQMNFGQYQIRPSSAYTFESDIWYHIWVESDPVADAGTGHSTIKINNVSLGLSSTGTVADKGSNYDKKFYIGSSISGDSVTDIYIGNIAFYPNRIAVYYGSPENPSSTDMYNWGPPEQKLAVGGQAYIQSSLGINKFIPSYELDVTGDINFTGNLRKSGVIQTLGGGGGSSPWTTSGSDIIYNTGNVRIGSYITHDGDTNTFFGFPLDDTFKITVGGFDRFRIISSGNIGIGTSSPGYKLDVNGDINMSSGSNFRINGVAQTFGGGSSVWSLNSGKAYYNSGNVGIGTSTPAYKLDVNGDINMSTGSSFRINGVAQTFGGGGGSSPWTTSGSNIYRSSGNVGIATTSPGYKLDVNGSMNVSGALYVGTPSPSAGTSGQVLTSTGGLGMAWTTVSSGGSSPWTTSGSDIIYNTGNVTIGNYITHDGDSDTYFGFPAYDQFTIRTAGSERFHINSSGYTTIGEDNDIGTGHRLTVVDGSTSNNGSYADLVITNRNENNNARLLLGTPYNQGSTSAFKAAIIADGAGSASRSDLHFCLDNSTDNTLNATLSDSKMIIKYNGNVGIGTTSPSYTLDVDGDINMSTGSNFRINGVAQTFGGGSSVWSLNSGKAYYNSGNVGIGESSPSAPLHIECADTSIPSQNGLLVKQTSYYYPAAIGIRSSNTNQDAFISFMINSDNTGWSYGVDASDSNKMKWGYSTTRWNDTRMTLTNDGRLGINRTSPAYNLDVNGDMKLTGGLHVNGSYGSSGQVLTSSGGGVMSWTTVSGGGGSSPWSTSGSDIYRSSGRVGIGTTTPGAPLEIRSSGSANPFDNGLLVYNNANYSNQDSIIAVRVGGSSAGDPFISFDVAGEAGWAFGIDNNDGNKLKWSSNAGNLTTTKMTLDTSGNLGIGTTSPGYKLDVFGTVNFTGVLTVGTTASSGTAGQVLTSGGSAAPPSWTTVSGGGGGSSPWTTSGSDIIYNTGNVTIGSYITHDGDSDTYFGFPGDNQFVLRTGGNDRLNIDSSGRLTVPSYITHTGDTNTFFGFPLDDTFKITVGGFDRFRIISSGNIGIGTSSPGYKLDVDGDINMSSGSNFRINGVAQTFGGGGGGGSSPWTTSGSNIYRSSGQVNIGGSTFTRAKLEINGSYGSYVYFKYYAYGSYGNFASGTVDYSIYCNERIAANEFNAHSDIRIKKNITDINDSSALDKIRLLEPKIYNYIDELERGTSNVYGFIAQQVYDVLPYAVTVSEGDIPNILRNSNVSVTSDSNILELHLDTCVEGLSLSNTSVINIITDDDKELKCNVLSFSESNVITIENTGDFSNVTNAFIKGEQVNDFHHLNKDAIWAVSTAALQEVDRQLQVEKEKVSTLETQVADLLARVTALENN